MDNQTYFQQAEEIPENIIENKISKKNKKLNYLKINYF